MSIAEEGSTEEPEAPASAAVALAEKPDDTKKVVQHSETLQQMRRKLIGRIVADSGEWPEAVNAWLNAIIDKMRIQEPNDISALRYRGSRFTEVKERVGAQTRISHAVMPADYQTATTHMWRLASKAVPSTKYPEAMEVVVDTTHLAVEDYLSALLTEELGMDVKVTIRRFGGKDLEVHMSCPRVLN